MAIPAGVEQVTITDGGVALTGPDGAPLEGYFTVTGPELATVREDDFLFSGSARRWLTAGRFDPLVLVATDATDVDPTGFTYAVTFTPKRGATWTRYIALPKAAPSVVLADILVPDPVAGTYTGGPSSGSGPSPASSVVTETGYGQAAQVGAAAAYARGDHSHGTPALPTPAAIGAETPAGAQARADGAAASATGAAAADATSKVAAHTVADDPHLDRAYTDTQVASRVPTSRTITAGAGLSGGGSLAADRTLAVSFGSTAGTATEGNDSRLANARTPTAHASSHASGGSDPVSPAAIGALPSSGGFISGSLAVAGHALGQSFPAAHGAAAWVYDPALAVNSTLLTSGTLYLVRVNIAAAVNATRLYWWAGNSGSGAVAGQNEVGLYDSTGARLAAANVDADVSSAGLKSTVIPSTPLAAGAWYWVALLFNASVPPTLTRASGWTGVEAAANLGLAAGAYRFAINGTGRTALPASIVPASNAGTDFAGPWVAVGA